MLQLNSTCISVESTDDSHLITYLTSISRTLTFLYSRHTSEIGPRIACQRSLHSHYWSVIKCSSLSNFSEGASTSIHASQQPHVQTFSRPSDPVHSLLHCATNRNTRPVVPACAIPRPWCSRVFALQHHPSVCLPRDLKQASNEPSHPSTQTPGHNFTRLRHVASFAGRPF